MQKCFIILCVLCLLSLEVFCQVSYSYEDFLNDQIKYSKIRDLISEANYLEAIEILQSIDCKGILCRSKNIYLANSYAGLRDKEKTNFYLKLAVSQGYSLEYLDKEIFKGLIEKKEYENFFETYLQSIDTSLRNQLIKMGIEDQRYRPAYSEALRVKNSLAIDTLGNLIKSIDSINIEQLKNITCQYGWPGVTKVGHSNPFSPNPQASIIVVHANEKNNVLFMEKALDSCKNQEDEWFSAESIMSNLLMRFASKDYPYNKLRFRACLKLTNLYNAFSDLA